MALHICPVDIEKRPLQNKFVDMVKKHLPMMRIPEYNLRRAADHLEAWVEGRLPSEPLSDISGNPS